MVLSAPGSASVAEPRGATIVVSWSLPPEPWNGTSQRIYVSALFTKFFVEPYLLSLEIVTQVTRKTAVGPLADFLSAVHVRNRVAVTTSLQQA